MKRRIRIATAVAALGAMCLFLIPLANGAQAAAKFDDYQMVGFARGLTFTFSFKDFVLEKVLDIGIPHAATELGTSAGGAARAEAAQVFPGDVIAGAAPGALAGVADGLAGAPPPFSTIGGMAPRGLPGYSVSYYPPGQVKSSDTVSGALQRPLPSSAGPISIQNSQIETAAHLKDATAKATSNRVLIANGATPVLEAASISTSSAAKANGSQVSHVARTAIHNLTLTLSPDLIIKIGGVVTEATTSSNGETGDGDASITVSDVRVISGGDTYAATIDGKGIHLTGPVPTEVPSSLDQDLGQQIDAVAKGISDTGVTIKTGSVFKEIEEATAETSVSGLIIGFTGRVPRLPSATSVALQVVNPIVDMAFPTYCPAKGKLPQPLQDRDIPPPFDQIFKQLPVCVTPNVVPGPGTGSVASLSLGSVASISAASPAFVFEPGGNPPAGPPLDIPGGELGPIPGGDFGIPGGGNGGSPPGVQQPQAALTGLVARMPPGALLGAGVVFLVVAVAVAMGPSLRRWRSAT